ncbi:hypothetical protein [Botrimarina hoheduenensis]|uniref:Uncharacterized protein n=1 Tax=Botrimarina hoheduenensis TaxID=2528000 RepID=A0A5C5VXP4_9BACT|nr:hypothetical protein [Botrimarina hoheduenensis]TWT43396.1 hypothetical protein Pla111_23470 [Botrimarina hoheduenensis]
MLHRLFNLPNDSPEPGRGPKFRGLRAAAIVLLSMTVWTAPGCRCTPETPQEKIEREAREAAEVAKRQEEELAKAAIRLPLSSVLPAAPGEATLSAKLGHWNEVAQPLVANATDFDGQLSHVVTNKEGQPLLLDRTPFAVESLRPLVVAQKSSKTSRTPVYFPPVGGPQKLRTVVRDRTSGVIYADPLTETRQLLDHQYQILVLAAEPSRYAFLDGLTSVSGALPQSIDLSDAKQGASTLPAARNYRVVAPEVVKDSPTAPLLPETPLAWTSIAYVFWDGVDPEALTPEQRDALIDWIHWGGQLIVNGPNSVDLLRGSYLEPLLGVTGGAARRITQQELDAVESTWRTAVRQKPQLTLGKNGWSGIVLDPSPRTFSLPGLESLLYERRVGRGRVVTSALQLAEPGLLAWSDGVENLYNGAVLRRPGRLFITDPGSGSTKTIAKWAKGDPIALDPLRNTAVRMFVRDTHADAGQLIPPLIDETDGNQTVTIDGMLSSFQRLVPPPVRGGAGAWSDDNQTASSARDVLRRSSGVSVPTSAFVLGCLGFYLLVLVPLNWGFFYAVGRLELAWVAAPIIALVAAVLVVQQAQLDIGFVRAQTEIAVLETQPDAPRGILTRFSALYTSLSTSYDLEFDSPTAIAAPFARLAAEEADQQSARGGALLTGEAATVSFERLEKARLRGLGVSSASTEFVRSEEMLDLTAASYSGLAGGVVLGESLTGVARLENRTKWPMADVALVRRRDGVEGAPELEGCWIGSLPAGETSPIAYVPIATLPKRAVFRSERDDARAAASVDLAELDLEPLFAIALDPQHFEPGESRVVARIDGVRAGLTITPAASQQRGATLLVAHLAYGPLPAPAADKNPPGKRRTSP